MPTFVFDDDSFGRLKRLPNNKMLSAYVAADARGDKIGLVLNKARTEKQDSTKAIGKALRKELGVNKFCRGLLIKDADGAVTFVNLGGSISNGLLKKLLKKLGDGMGGDRRARLNGLRDNLQDKSYLEALRAAPSSGDSRSDDTATDAPNPLAAELAELERLDEAFIDPRDILAEEMEITAEARKSFLEARESGEGLVEAAAALASALDTGSNIFDNAEDSAVLAKVYDALIDDRFVDPDVGFMMTFEDQESRPAPPIRTEELVFLGERVPILVVSAFDSDDGTGRACFLDGDGTRVYPYDGEDLEAWCRDTVAQAQETFRDTQTQYIQNRESIGSQSAAEMLVKALTDLQIWVQTGIVHMIGVNLRKGREWKAFSDKAYRGILKEASGLLALNRQLIVEVAGAEQLFRRLPSEPLGAAPEVEDEWSDEELDFLDQLETVQLENLRRIFAASNGWHSFKFQTAPLAYPDILRHAGQRRPRALGSKPFSKALKEIGYSDKLTGEYAIDGKTMYYTLSAPQATTISRIRCTVQAWGGEAIYVANKRDLEKAQEPTVGESILRNTQGKRMRQLELASAQKELLTEEWDAIMALTKKLNNEKEEGELSTSPFVELLLRYPTQVWAFFAKEFSTENLLFVAAVHPKLARLRGTYPELQPMMGRTGVDRIAWLYTEFVEPNVSPREINISSPTRAYHVGSIGAYLQHLDAQDEDPLVAGAFDGPIPSSPTQEYADAVSQIQRLCQDSMARFVTDFTGV